MDTVWCRCVGAMAAPRRAGSVHSLGCDCDHVEGQLDAGSSVLIVEAVDRLGEVCVIAPCTRRLLLRAFHAWGRDAFRCAVVMGDTMGDRSNLPEGDEPCPRDE